MRAVPVNMVHLRGRINQKKLTSRKLTSYGHMSMVSLPGAAKVCGSRVCSSKDAFGSLLGDDVGKVHETVEQRELDPKSLKIAHSDPRGEVRTVDAYAGVQPAVTKCIGTAARTKALTLLLCRIAASDS